MRAPYNYIIYTENRYNNETSSGLVVNTEITERDGEFVNRVGEVVGTPLMDDLNIPMGAKVIVHHNVFRRWYDVRGNEKNSRGYWDENRYIVDPEQLYAYDTGDGWKSLPRFCFVKPLEIRTGALENRQECVGHIVIGNENSPPVGSKVAYRPDCEYTFYIDEVKLYRVYLNDICILLNEHKEEETTVT